MNRIKRCYHSPGKLFEGILRRIGFLLPDRLFLKCQYFLIMGERLNLNNPSTFTEKIQWLKLYNRRPEYHLWIDKYEVKKYVASVVGDRYLIPTLGVWDRFKDMDVDSLPDQFILKSTHGSHASVICRNKAEFDRQGAQRLFEKMQRTSPYKTFREWAYKDVKPRIIAEQLMVNGNDKELTDYKFFCFNGEVKYCQVIKDRSGSETIDFFDAEWNHQEFIGLLQKKRTMRSATKLQVPIEKPSAYDEMIEVARKLAVNQPFVRIDLYEINGRVYFGEITFYPAAGLGVFEPAEWNQRLGTLIRLPIKERRK